MSRCTVRVMVWYDTFDAVFFLSAGSVVLAALASVLASCFKSKCVEFSLCSNRGCLYVRRDADAENIETQIELDHIPGNQTTNGDFNGSVV